MGVDMGVDIHVRVDYIFPLPDTDKLNRKDTTLLTLLPDKLQIRLGGCLVDFDDLESHTELGKVLTSLYQRRIIIIYTGKKTMCFGYLDGKRSKNITFHLQNARM